MLRPNSPRPPSGTTSTAGAPATPRRGHTHANPSQAQPGLAQATGAPSGEGTPHAGGLRMARATDAQNRRPGRWEPPEKTRRVSRNYSTASLRAGQGVRQAPPIRPGAASRDVARIDTRRASTAVASRRPLVANGLRALAIVFRRCVNIVRTIRTTRSGRRTGNGGGRKVRRTTADWTWGAGRNAPGGRASRGVTSALRAVRSVSTPYSRCRPPPVDRPLRSAASGSRRDAAVRCGQGQADGTGWGTRCCRGDCRRHERLPPDRGAEPTGHQGGPLALQHVPLDDVIFGRAFASRSPRGRDRSRPRGGAPRGAASGCVMAPRSRANFHDLIAPGWRTRLHDLDLPRGLEEVLREPLARPNHR